MPPLFPFFWRNPRTPLTSALPAEALAALSLEFEQSFEITLRHALDLGREGHVRMVVSMDQRRDPFLQYTVDEWAFSPPPRPLF